MPLYLSSSPNQPYTYLTIQGQITSPQLTFEPAVIGFLPMPLVTEATADIEITAKGYARCQTFVAVIFP